MQKLLNIDEEKNHDFVTCWQDEIFRLEKFVKRCGLVGGQGGVQTKLQIWPRRVSNLFSNLFFAAA